MIDIHRHYSEIRSNIILLTLSNKTIFNEKRRFLLNFVIFLKKSQKESAFLLEPTKILVDDTRSVSLSLIMLIIR